MGCEGLVIKPSNHSLRPTMRIYPFLTHLQYWGKPGTNPMVKCSNPSFEAFNYLQLEYEEVDLGPY
jgi:hypothetical protein